MSKKKPFSMIRNEDTNALCGNTILDIMYKGRLRELAMARFNWLNLPPEIDERFLEMSLNEYGMIGFFRDEIANRYVALPAMINGDFDIYMNPIKFRVWAVNGYQRELDKSDGVICYNNMLKSPTFPWLDYYAEQLYEIDQVRRVNIKAQKTPICFRGDDKQRLTLKNIWLKYDGNEPFFIVDENVPTSNFTVLKTDAPFLCDKFTEMRRHIMGEIMIYLGYETQEATQKTERVLKGEIEAAQSESASYRYSPLIMRRKFCDEINRKFGLNVEVNFRQPLSTVAEIDDPLLQMQIKDPNSLVKEVIENE